MCSSADADADASSCSCNYTCRGGLLQEDNCSNQQYFGKQPGRTVHCKSKNDDLGFHTLLPKHTYEFSFKRNAFGNGTLFFCSFTWPEEPQLHYLDIYDQKRDDCSKCFWEVFKFGACLYDNCKRWNNS
ncbi:hypothetical protein D8674_017439 [Pyrus ussuriensis x Pyrus communis]|uniref:S-protein homolog n=1 Tax=Pyrus ussuriensis x Pyrus communis TaxID=2448454 RepID=A0A5N5HCQ4_9ROSA|nr:hypothetical protein D8674_017439 [Pyrus ussuriensis x Pyrus communis]